MERIGRHYYAKLKNLSVDELTAEMEKQMIDYEAAKEAEMTEEQKEKAASYYQKVIEPDTVEVRKMEKNQLWREFLQAYKRLYRIDFITDEQVTENLAPIFYYFLQDERFFKCKALSDITDPSFEKGLLIVGGYGNGKSSVMNALRHVLIPYSNTYAFRNMNDVVTDYELCHEPEDKSTFWSMITRGKCLFDDVKTERAASNYGKLNIFKDVLEKRYLNKNVTHITCNFREGSNSVSDSLEEFGEKYGSRVYDRLFEMFNVIEFKGKSMRK